MAIGVAILGAGLFGKDEYFPAIKSNSNFSLKAVYSRSQQSATKFGVEAGVDAYYDTPETSNDKSLNTLLERPDIDAVIVALPITVQPDIIRAALKAGKHVLSEKPISEDTTIAKQLIAEYEPYKAKGLVWSVAENFRFINTYTYGAEQLRRLGGEVTSFQISVHDLIKEGNPFFASEWRKKPEYPGGFILDAGVHFVAGLRLFLSALDDSIVKVVGFSTQATAHLPPVDSVNGAFSLKSGRGGTINFSFGTEFKNDFLIEVVSSNGSVSVTSAGVTVVEKDKFSGKQSTAIKSFPSDSGIGLEIEAFGNAVHNRTPDERQTAEEALVDLLLVEKLLESGDAGGVVISV